MSAPLNKKALEAAYREFNHTGVRGAIAAYFASLAEQGIVLVDVREVTAAILQAHPLPDGADWPSRKAWADWIEARFAPEGRRTLDTVLGPIKVMPECKRQAVCTNGVKCWEAGVCLLAEARFAPEAKP